jgi:SNF2 family DNA or RNA helicase
VRVVLKKINMKALENQIEFYNQLLDTEKNIVKAFALKGAFNLPSEITDILMLRIRVTQKKVKELIERSVSAGIIVTSNDHYYYGTPRYKVFVPFMVYVYPQLEGFESEWLMNKGKFERFFYFNESDVFVLVKNFLYELLYEKNVSVEVQNQLLNHSQILGELDITVYPEYLKNIKKLSPELINRIYLFKINKLITELSPVDQLIELKNTFEFYLGKNSGLLSLENNIDFYKGDFGNIIKRGTSNQLLVVEAISNLITGNPDNAIKLFDQQLKLLRKEYKGIQIFPVFVHNYFYFVTLLCVNSDECVTRAQKILNTFDKVSYAESNNYFKTILFNILNKKAEKELEKESIYAYILNTSDMVSLFLISMLYLAELTPPANATEYIIQLIQKGYDSENYLFTYEAAYVADKWFGTSETAQLYQKVAARMSYPPVCSLINRQEEWEKSLNLLFNSIGGLKSSNVTTKSSENNTRVIYLFTPQYMGIKPILQTRNAKGEWSKGRNIAMKTFYEGRTQGMTEQDVRISKTIRHYKGGYYDPDLYDFSSKVIVELVGHPFIFLDGANEIPIEFVAAQPEISVTPKKNCYILKSNISDFTSGIFVKKETNTRYNVYNLSTSQMNMLKILTQQNITIPEYGKEKLIQLLGEMSKYATVHSDVLGSTAISNQNVKMVQPDNRIRVQLLPFGDGLKAELFVKPFGEFPPYCKPGLGGKILITSQNGEQLQVKRDLETEQKYSNLLLNDIQQLESVNMNEELIAFNEPLDSLNLLDVLAAYKNECVVEWPEGERFKISSIASFSNLNLQIKSKNNWFELEGELKVNEDTVISIQQLMTLKSHGRFVELKDGEFIALSNELKKRLDELYTFSVNGKNGLQINKFASIALGNTLDNVDNLKTDKAWKSFRNQIELQYVSEASIPSNLQAELRPYQEEGFRWLSRLSEWNAGACLADDMGLGKTVQTLAILLHRASKGAAMVICPVSVIGNWISEAQRFAPTLNVKVLGNNDRQQILNDLGPGDVLITSYGLLQSEVKLFVEKKFATVVLDEAHVIKNYATKTSKATMQLKADFRLALTGTPLQNHQGEIWNLFNFIVPGLLGNLNHFTNTFIKPDNDYARRLLKKLIAPFILRRTKTAVLDELPPKTEIIKKVQLSDAEIAFYEALRRQAIINLESDGDNQGGKHIQALAEITRLRQACCNPLLVDANIGIESSKLTTFLEITDELIENKHRALVFSQFVSHLNIIRKALDKKGITYQYLDGSTPIPERERSVKNFQSGEGELFLISLKAGGLGLNLTSADFVIHLDPWWNPAIEDQASDRAYRIGQNRPVTVYRLVAENTIEEKIIKLHDTKRDLAESLLEGSDQSVKLSFNELVSLIRESF